MRKATDHSIRPIRTFDEDFAHAQGTEIVKTPTLQKENKTAQDDADKILDTQATKAVIVSTDNPEATNLLTADIEVDVDIPATEIAAAHPNTSVPASTPPPQVNNLVIEELEDEVVSVGREQSRSVQTTEGAVYDVSNNELDGGTLITNKKLVKHGLFSSIVSALTAWFSSKKTEITAVKKPEHTVTSAQSRIETITAAARAGKHAPQSDHGVMIKRLTKKKKKVPTHAVKIIKKDEAAAPQWDSSAEVDTTPVPEIVSDISSEEVVPVLEAGTLPPIVPETIETVPEIEVTPEPAEPEPEPEPELSIETPQEDVPRKKRTYRATPTAASGVSKVSIYVYILVIAGASLLGIGVSVYWFMSSTPMQEAVVIRIPSLFASDVEVPVTLSDTGPATLSTILDLSIATRETTQIYPVVTDATGTQMPADAQAILSALELRAPGSFTRAITDITFGSYNGTDPFIIMKVTNFDTAFGGILQWEADLSEDLAPLFGIPVTESYDPYARTNTLIRPAFFRDTIVANKSARLLVDAQDDERLLYSFINPNLILITTNADTFNAVLPLVTQ